MLCSLQKSIVYLDHGDEEACDGGCGEKTRQTSEASLFLDFSDKCSDCQQLLYVLYSFDALRQLNMAF